MQPHIPVELELVLACARTPADQEAVARQQRRCVTVRNWDAVLSHASRHRMNSLVYANLARLCGHLAPAPVLQELRSRAEANAVNSLALTRELLEVLERFRRAGVAAIPYKGPTLALTAYGDVSLREFVDLDLLVRKDEVLRARDALLAAGWAPEYAMNAQQERRYMRHACEYNFERGGTALELHWQIVPPHLSIDYPVDEVWDRAHHIEISGRQVPVPCSEDLLLILAVHGAKHLWCRVQWLCDIAQTVRTSPSLDWDALCARALQIGAARILHVALRLANRLLAAPVPERVIADADSAADRICARYIRSLAAPAQYTPLRNHFAALDLRERWRDRARYVWRVSKAPGPVAQGERGVQRQSRLMRLVNHFGVRG